ncbi:MAG: extracellular solute-binding protein [Firmicutes bacterium]|nr:extracellular solute-binding protein [Bacillota bacterium]
MKKALAMILSTVMAASMLAGCGGNERTGDAKGTETEGETKKETTQEGTETVTLLSWYSEEQLGEFIEAFETEYPNIHVDLQYVPPVQQYVDKFSVLVASGQMTDMFYTAAENKQDVIEKELAEDISDMEIFSRINPDTSATYGEDGKIYAYSPDAWIGGVFYNKNLFREAGIEQEPQTWDEFVDACKKLKDLGVEPYMDDADNVHNLAQDLYQCMVISKDPDADQKINEGKSTFTETYTEPLKIWYEDLVESGLYSPASLGMNSDQTIDMFANEQVAMIHGGPWTISTIEAKNPELEYDIFGISDKDGNCVMPGALNVGISISKASEHKKACRTFLEFMQREENILKWQQVSNNAIIVEGIDYSMDTVFEKVKEDAVEGNFYLPQIAWKNSSGIYKEFLSGIQDTITGADTIEHIPVRLDEKQAELSK